MNRFVARASRPWKLGSQRADPHTAQSFARRGMAVSEAGSSVSRAGRPCHVCLRSEVRDYGMQGSMEMLKSWGFSHIKAAEKMFNT